MRPGLLTSPEVVAWLGGRERAWTLLTFDSWRALNRKPGEGGAVLAISDTHYLAACRDALAFLSRIGSGVRLTAALHHSAATLAQQLPA